jgi:hypothetical protein
MIRVERQTEIDGRNKDNKNVNVNAPKNSTFRPQSAFMCFVWLSEQTAIISLYSCKRLVFITEMESVYCAVRTGSTCNVY